VVGPADEPAAAGGRAVLDAADTGALLDRLGRLWADSAYRGEFAAAVPAEYGVAVEVVARPPEQRGFVVQPRRWAVEMVLSQMTSSV
jgi:transposase